MLLAIPNAQIEVEADGEQVAQDPESQKHDDAQGKVGMSGAYEEADEVGEVRHGEVVQQVRDFGQIPRKLQLLHRARKSGSMDAPSIRPGRGPFEVG